MRITCPNCLAQYEIDGNLLPPEGREVQCSACDHIWFQSAPARKNTRAAPQIGASTQMPEEIPVTAPKTWLEEVPLPDNAPKIADTASMNAPESAVQHDFAEPEEPEEPESDIDDRRANRIGERIFPEATRPRARALDASVTDVLRQEAEFEATQRQRDAEPVETQPDLGLLGGNPWPAFRDPDGPDLNKDDDFTTEAPSNTPSSFPDIDDVSATLDPLQASRQTEIAGYDLPMTAQDRQRSFLQGFIIPVALGGLMVGFYLAAPLLAALIPPAAPVLNGYIDAIDAGRAALASAITGR